MTTQTPTALPVASARAVRVYAKNLLLSHLRELVLPLSLHGLAAVAGLIAPWMLGRLVQDAGRGWETATRAALVICAAFTAQAVLTGLATTMSSRLGEKVLARLREKFIGDVLALPLAAVERAGSGELISRTTRDIDALSRTVQLAVPDMLVSLATILLTLGGLVLVSPVLALPCMVAVPVLWASTRWYLRRSREGYLRAGASYAHLAEGLAETVDGADTVEALNTADRRFSRVNRDIARSYGAERYTLFLRSVYLPIADTGYILPAVATLVIGGLLYQGGIVTLASVTAATLYVQQLIGPVDRLLYWMDELQVGAASMARVLGPAQAESDDDASAASDERPRAHRPSPGQHIVVDGVSYAYRAGHDVLRDIRLEIAMGERLAIVGPSGAGKSTLGRLLAGIHRPTMGSITIGGVPLADLTMDELRRHVALVTQEHHVFCGTLRDNLLISKPDAGDEELEAALETVDAWHWAAELGLAAEVGSGAARLSPGQAQQLALARLVLADPRALVLDEATSLLSPGSARQLERGLAALLRGRTIITIAHRLHSAHDADRIVALQDGRITDQGTHVELVRRGGPYAALWASWHGAAEQPAFAAEAANAGREDTWHE